jgi:hypothetical protein
VHQAIIFMDVACSSSLTSSPYLCAVLDEYMCVAVDGTSPPYLCTVLDVTGYTYVSF